MPPRKAHEDKARSIERMLSLLDDHNADHWDWVVTLAFYAALHWLDATFADGGLHPSNTGNETGRCKACQFGMNTTNFIP